MLLTAFKFSTSIFKKLKGFCVKDAELFEKALGKFGMSLNVILA